MKASLFGAAALLALSATVAAAAPACDKACLEAAAYKYRQAYFAHDLKLAPFAAKVRFTENNVEMAFPDGTWDTVTRNTVPSLTLSDPVTGNVGFFTAIDQGEVPGYLAVRLKVVGGKITEVEHVISTKRNLSGPPTPFGDPAKFQHDPDLERAVAADERMSRADLVRLADGYFETLENNTGEIRHTAFTPDATRHENGQAYPGIENNFKLARFPFNERVRDRDYFLVDEARGVVMARAYIDHKGMLKTVKQTDGSPPRPSVFLEPHTWGMLEMFKMKKGRITGVEATFIQSAYYQRSPWTKRLDAHNGGLTPSPPPPAPSKPLN